MAVERIDHVQLAMPEGGEEAARGFYRDLLGLPEIAKPPNLAPRGGCWFGNGSVSLHLGVEEAFRPARKAHPALMVSDLAALVDRLRTQGCRIVEDQPLAGYERCYVDDPFGNRIELMEPHTRL